VSLLIGKRLQTLRSLFDFSQIIPVYCSELFDEIREVTSRPKFSKYFKPDSIERLLGLFERAGTEYHLDQIKSQFVDPKDDYLLTLIEVSGADYLVTGDKALLNLGTHADTSIVSAGALDDILYSLKLDYCTNLMRSLASPIRFKMVQIILDQDTITKSDLFERLKNLSSNPNAHLRLLKNAGILEVVGSEQEIVIDHGLLIKIGVALSNFK